jgi:hypothetical protein
LGSLLYHSTFSRTLQLGYIRKNVCIFLLLVRFIGLCVVYTPSTNKTKEETTMNKTAVRRMEIRRYPNAASRQYKIDKAIDTLLTIAAASGLTLVILFLIFI